ncbi:MAG: co-chaperone DjlA [Deltaproteobacteria bacterium]|nr:co-chaperone DjlA [Deltaproteobacteria bacterium]
MNWWGKLIGGTVGFMMGGPLGAVLGAALGHSFDKGRTGAMLGGPFGAGDSEQIQAAFFTAMFSVMGYLARVDGHVTRDEIEMARGIMARMQLTPEQKKAAINLFHEGKRPNFPLDDVLDQFRRVCHQRRNLMQMFLEILIMTALADGALDKAERTILIHVCERVGFSRAQFEQLVNMLRAHQHYQRTQDYRSERFEQKGNLGDAYAVLGVSEKDSDDEIKKAYRKLMNQYHPDKLISKGLPEEMMKFATEKTQEIKSAYDRIKEARAAA